MICQMKRDTSYTPSGLLSHTVADLHLNLIHFTKHNRENRQTLLKLIAILIHKIRWNWYALVMTILCLHIKVVQG